MCIDSHTSRVTAAQPPWNRLQPPTGERLQLGFRRLPHSVRHEPELLGPLHTVTYRYTPLHLVPSQVRQEPELLVAKALVDLRRAEARERHARHLWVRSRRTRTTYESVSSRGRLCKVEALGAVQARVAALAALRQQEAMYRWVVTYDIRPLHAVACRYRCARVRPSSRLDRYKPLHAVTGAHGCGRAHASTVTNRYMPLHAVTCRYRCARVRPSSRLDYLPSGMHALAGDLKRVCRCPATVLSKRFAELGLGSAVPRHVPSSRERSGQADASILPHPIPSHPIPEADASTLPHPIPSHPIPEADASIASVLDRYGSVLGPNSPSPSGLTREDYVRDLLVAFWGRMDEQP